MALQVWLPLTKDLKNQGLANVTIEEVTTATFTNNGKLGKALSSGKIRIPATDAINIFNNNAMTIAFWYNNNTSETTGNHAICGFSGNSEGDSGAVRSWDFFNYSTPNNFHWSMGTLGGGSYANILPANTWVHFCIVWNGSRLKIYVDGVLKTDASGTSEFTFDKSYYISFGHTPQLMNDFRIYDHALSPMEVKQLSQGLVLHYPLNRNGWGQENQLKNSNFINGTTNWYSVNSSSIRTEIKDGRICGTGTKGTSANILGQTSASYTANTNINITVSAKVYVEEAGTIGIGHWITTTQASGWQSMSGSRVWHTTANLSVGWNYISSTLKNATNQYTGSIVTCFSYTGTTYWITDVKLEFGEIATPWCPNSSDALATTMGLNGTTEYDCSGFGNNGTRTGTFEWTSDAPKYSVSTKFSDGAYITHKLPESMYQATYAFWVKSTTYTGYGMIYGPAGSPSAGTSPWLSVNTESVKTWAYFGNNSPNYTKGDSGSISTNEWHHCVYVFDNGVGRWYLDGVACGNAVTYTTRTFIQNTANATIGDSYTGTSWSGTPFTGQLSDFRVYATALSASDVLSLYQNSAYIDSSGNIYGTIHET